MPLIIHTHRLDGSVALEDVAKAHQADLHQQGRHDVSCLRYWVAEPEGVLYSPVEAPSAQVHKEAHGLLADAVAGVKEGS